jgi:hypothetical protein
MTLEQSLRDLCAQHNLTTIELRVRDNGCTSAVVFWDDNTSDTGCQCALGHGDTLSECFQDALAVANARRSVTIPDAPLVFEVAA